MVGCVQSGSGVTEICKSISEHSDYKDIGFSHKDFVTWLLNQAMTGM
jgi:hypothetical protein